MDSLVIFLLSYLELYRYVALAAVVYIGAVGAPLPINIMLLALGAFASHGYFSFWLSLAITATFNTLGDLTGYGIARKYENAITRILRVRKARFFVNLEKELRSDAAITVLVTRFAGSLSSVANFLSGFAKVPLRTFIVNDVIGNVLEPGMWLIIGYVVGDYWTTLSNLTTSAAAVVAILAIIFIFYRMQQRLMRKYASDTMES